MDWRRLVFGLDWTTRTDFIVSFIFDWRKWLWGLVPSGGGVTFLWAAVEGRSPLDVWLAAVGVMAGLAFVVFVALKVIETRRNKAPAIARPEAEKPSEKPLILPKSLKELFDSDFPHLGKKMRLVPITFERTPTFDCVMLVHQDFESGVEFISLYIPGCGRPVDVCDYFANNFRRDYDQLKAQIHFNIRRPGETVMDRSSDLRLSGRVYLYHEDEMDYEGYARVTGIFRMFDLAPRFRGQSYRMEEWKKRLLAQA
jgi:hypothetical protein